MRGLGGRGSVADLRERERKEGERKQGKTIEKQQILSQSNNKKTDPFAICGWGGGGGRGEQMMSREPSGRDRECDVSPKRMSNSNKHNTNSSDRGATGSVRPLQHCPSQFARPSWSLPLLQSPTCLQEKVGNKVLHGAALVSSLVSSSCEPTSPVHVFTNGVINPGALLRVMAPENTNTQKNE